MSTNHMEIAKKRLKIIFAFFVLLCVVVLARSFQLQIVEHEKWAEKAKERQAGEVTVAAKRGDIEDRNGKLLATSVKATNIAVDPGLVENPAEVAKALASILELDESHILKHCSPSFVPSVRTSSSKTNRPNTRWTREKAEATAK